VVLKHLDKKLILEKKSKLAPQEGIRLLHLNYKDNSSSSKSVNETEESAFNNSLP
jgi:hypothetical protein